MWRRILLFVLVLGMGPVQSLSAQSRLDSYEKKALIRSLILPGWGQQALSEGTSARRFITAEASLWLGYLLTDGLAGQYAQDYRAFAALHAGVDDRLKPDIYYYRLGEYDSITQYNQIQLRQRNLDAVYPLGTDLDWEWDQVANREHYVDLRRTSLRFTKAASFAIGGMVVNRALAAIHILFLSKQDRLSGAASAQWTSFPGGGLLRINLQI